MPDTPDPGSKFTMAEPVVTAGASTSAAVVVTGAIMELCEAYDWQHFTTQQTTAIYGLVGVLVGLGSALIARQHVTPQHKVDALVAEALATPVPVSSNHWLPGSEISTGPSVATIDYTTSYGDRLVAEAKVAQHLATQPAPNIDDIDPPHMAGAILDGSVIDPFAT